jgi:hypothetical protein
MQQLTNAEEQLMEHSGILRKPLWKIYSNHFRTKTKDHYRGHFTERMIDKDFVAYTEFGNSREYYPLV